MQAAAMMELTGIHQLLSGLAETLAAVYWLRRELLWRGKEALVVRLNCVFLQTQSQNFMDRGCIWHEECYSIKHKSNQPHLMMELDWD
jgi:hypothetical protein